MSWYNINSLVNTDQKAKSSQQYKYFVCKNILYAVVMRTKENISVLYCKINFLMPGNAYKLYNCAAMPAKIIRPVA